MVSVRVSLYVPRAVVVTHVFVFTLSGHTCLREQVMHSMNDVIHPTTVKVLPCIVCVL